MIRLLNAFLVLCVSTFLLLPVSAHEYMYPAKVVRVIDGDTIVVDINLGLKHIIQKEQIRLYGINTPEMRTQEGKDIKHMVEKMILGETVILETIKDKRGKYGRVLGIIYLENGKQLNLWLLENGHAKEFMAETKDLINRSKR